MSRSPMMIVSLPQVEYQFLQELMTRVTREGLLIPDELPYAASIWTRIRQAQTVMPPAPTEDEAPGAQLAAQSEGMPAEEEPSHA